MFRSSYKRLNIQRHAIRLIPYTLGVRAMNIVFGCSKGSIQKLGHVDADQSLTVVAS